MSAFFMALLLLCITLCISITNSSFFDKTAEQIFLTNETQSQHDEDLPQNPFPGSSEEKTENSINSLSEFLPELFADNDDLYSSVEMISGAVELYIAFHSELIPPPPKS